MSYKTDRLVDLFPAVYAVRDRTSLLYRLLDAAGAEFMAADGAIKALLKSHWVDYANGPALDGLGAIFGVERRRLLDGSLEPDNAFRLRLKSIVPLFTGGGTRRAILGAVRSALGLPFDLAQLNLPPQFSALRQDLENLVRLEEFSPQNQRLVVEISDPSQAGSLILDAPIPSVYAESPLIEWTFTHGSGRRLHLERLGSGLGAQSIDDLIFPEGETLRLSRRTDGSLAAFLGTNDVSSMFQGLGGNPAVMPELPPQGSQWLFTAESGLFDFGIFDQFDTFDRPLFRVEMTWISHQPLTFDVYVPYFLKSEVDRLVQVHNYPGAIFAYEGLDQEVIQAVIDLARAAGVRGSVQFSISFSEDHAQQETFQMDVNHSIQEEANQDEALQVDSQATLSEQHDLAERFVVGGVYDFSSFDGVFGFVT
jgi:hypothetical protein